MRSSMHLDRSQFPTLIRYTNPGTFYLDLSRYLQVGFTQVYSLCVGAAGGNSGGNWYTDKGGISYIKNAAGGGGGGSRYRVHSLDAFASGGLTPIKVGLGGGHGADATGQFMAGSGGNGGRSEFGSGGSFNYADGGYGANAGGWFFNPGVGYEEVGSIGGYGGNADSEYGMGGTNGVEAQPSSPIETPTEGAWLTDGLSLPDLAIGIGGGGGGGRIYREGSFNRNGQSGRNGGDLYPGDSYSPGSPSNGYNGGPGGGCCEKVMTGANLHYGSRYPSSNVSPNGAVILKFV